MDPSTLATQYLACHGEPATCSSTLRSTLAQDYRHDDAIGYAVGEWRGLIRILRKP
jgi:hypothetical protein